MKMKIKTNMTRERYKDEWWDCEHADPIHDDNELESEVHPKRRMPKAKPPRTKLQQMELGLEYDIDEI